MSSFGEELRRERELRQISLREIAESTKINLRYLDALERNDFKHLPGGVFNKGFVRAYAEHIGVDPETMVNAYLLEEKAQDDHHDLDPGLWRGSSVRPAPESSRKSRAGLWVTVCVVALALLVAGGFLAYQAWTQRSAVSTTPVAPPTLARPGGDDRGPAEPLLKRAGSGWHGEIQPPPSDPPADDRSAPSRSEAAAVSVEVPDE